MERKYVARAADTTFSNQICSWGSGAQTQLDSAQKALLPPKFCHHDYVTELELLNCFIWYCKSEKFEKS